MQTARKDKKISVVILTYNRPQLLEKLLSHLAKIRYPEFEVIVVDNHSEHPVDEIVDSYHFAQVIRMPENVGVGGRNAGINAATGEIVITLDDDVLGITDEEINTLINKFNDETIGAICFKVLNEVTGEIMNWIHHRKREKYSESAFLTEEISEGAVAFSRHALLKTELYPEEFFISHEGPDLALRIMNAGYKVMYSPEIVVKHSHSPLGRSNWRRYYYDTRNLIWLILRNYPFLLGVKRLFIGLTAMAIYSLRDGFFRYWLKALYDAVKGSRMALQNRQIMTQYTRNILKEIDKCRPSIWYMIQVRLFKRKVRI